MIDPKGHVVGIVVGKANALKIVKATGAIPQNINFAIAPQIIQAFLDDNRIAFSSEALPVDRVTIRLLQTSDSIHRLHVA